MKLYLLFLFGGLIIAGYLGMSKYCATLAYKDVYRPYNLHRPENMEYKFDAELETRWHPLHGCQARMVGENVRIQP